VASNRSWFRTHQGDDILSSYYGSEGEGKRAVKAKAYERGLGVLSRINNRSSFRALFGKTVQTKEDETECMFIVGQISQAKCRLSYFRYASYSFIFQQQWLGPAYYHCLRGLTLATILIMTMPEKGHLNSTLKISRTLKARGHNVWHSNLVDFEEYILSHGLEFVPLFETLAPKGFTIGLAIGVSAVNALWEILISMDVQDGRTAQDLIDDEINSIIRKVGPDLLVFDSYFACHIPRTIAQIAHPCLLLNPTVEFPIQAGAPQYNDPMFARVLELPTLTLCPKEFDFLNSEKLDRHFYVEASVELQRKDINFAWHRISDEKPLVYCSLGTQSHWSLKGEDNGFNQRVRRNFLRNVIEAMWSKQDWQLVIAVGGHLGPEDFSATPNVIVVSHAPQLEILKRASVLITHGGLNTIKESILLGVPMVVFPMAIDQPGNAARVAYHRIGVRGSMASATAASIQAMVSRVYNDPTYKNNIDRMSRIFKRREEEGQAVKLIESHIPNQATAGI
jgi:UDP:flavonoid glycosyltransferase YjiC (YdhE family)